MYYANSFFYYIFNYNRFIDIINKNEKNNNNAYSLKSKIDLLLYSYF